MKLIKIINESKVGVPVVLKTPDKSTTYTAFFKPGEATIVFESQLTGQVTTYIMNKTFKVEHVADITAKSTLAEIPTKTPPKPTVEKVKYIKKEKGWKTSN